MAGDSSRAAGGDPRIKLVRAEQNGGVARARNRGNSHATGEWIAVLDSDDAFEPALEGVRRELLAGRGGREAQPRRRPDARAAPYQVVCVLPLVLRAACRVQA